MNKFSGNNSIAIDVMGSDHGPSAFIQAVRHALKNLNHVSRIYLLGDIAILKPLLKDNGLAESERLKIHHASQVIGMDEKPISSLKKKKDSSMIQGIQLVKQGDAHSLISAGNTGSLMAGGTIKLRTLPGVDRPALATIWPSKDRHFVVIDSGANPDARTEHLIHNAILGTHYAKVALRLRNPRIGLLSIGTEEGKGSELINTSHTLFKQLHSIINYKGLIEGFQVFEDQVDVVVCDGFVGNILLKTCESLFVLFKDFLKTELNKNIFRKLGGLLAMPAFKSIKKQLNPEQLAGAPLLGLKGHIIKSHGSSNPIALYHAIRIGSELVQYDLLEHIKKDVAQANMIIEMASY